VKPAEHHEGKSPMPITVETLAPSKSKDEVKVRHDPTESEMRSSHAGRPIHCYEAFNVTKWSQYKVEIIDAANGKPYGWCNCVSSVICKHIRIALADLRQRIPEFGQDTFGEGPQSEAQDEKTDGRSESAHPTTHRDEDAERATTNGVDSPEQREP
jgi:hypothetical protein